MADPAMNSEWLRREADVADALKTGMRKGQGLSVPYARTWEVSGCSAIHSLRSYPYDGVQVLSSGLLALGYPMVRWANGLIIECGKRTLRVAANRSARGDGPPDAYLVATEETDAVKYTGNAAEVVVELLRNLGAPAPSPRLDETLQIGFPGIRDSTATYVGSWQWNIHGEATDDEFVQRAANATLTAICKKMERDAGGADG